MNTIKRRKLNNKRTPWVRSRYSRVARSIRSLQSNMVMAQAYSNISAIRSTNGSKIEKAMAIAECQVNAFSEVSKIPLRGSKTV